MTYRGRFAEIAGLIFSEPHVIGARAVSSVPFFSPFQGGGLNRETLTSDRVARAVVEEANARTVVALASASTVVKNTNARTVAALASASTVVKEADARTVAALVSASTVVKEADARTVAALKSASMVVEEANARTVEALASASIVVEEADARTAKSLVHFHPLRESHQNLPSLLPGSVFGKVTWKTRVITTLKSSARPHPQRRFPRILSRLPLACSFESARMSTTMIHVMIMLKALHPLL